jgi:hypothetical protein
VLMIRCMGKDCMEDTWCKRGDPSRESILGTKEEDT